MPWFPISSNWAQMETFLPFASWGLSMMMSKSIKMEMKIVSKLGIDV